MPPKVPPGSTGFALLNMRDSYLKLLEWRTLRSGLLQQMRRCPLPSERWSSRCLEPRQRSTCRAWIPALNAALRAPLNPALPGGPPLFGASRAAPVGYVRWLRQLPVLRLLLLRRLGAAAALPPHLPPHLLSHLHRCLGLARCHWSWQVGPAAHQALRCCHELAA